MLGGTRFLGPPVVRQLLEAGHEVVLFHRGVHEHPDSAGAVHVHGDFARFGEHVPELIRRRPELVIDLAPYIDKDGHGVLHFLAGSARAVVTTSQDVYRAFAFLHGSDPTGRPQPTPLTEESETRTGPAPEMVPQLDYDNLEVEQALTGEAAPVTVLRLPLIYGPHDPQRRLTYYVRRMYDGRRAILLDERLARFRWSRSYVENVAAAVVLASTDHRARGRTYNVAERHTAAWEEWVRDIADVCGWKGEIVALPAERVPMSLHFPVPAGQDLDASSERIRRELGYSEVTEIGVGLRRAIEWERAQQTNEPAPDYSDEDAVLASL